jgi:NADH pyrophosphatase NudC (nudix superfamily)
MLGAPAPKLAELLKQSPGGAPGAAPAGAAPGGAAAASKFCGRCGNPMQYVAQYQRWFCQHCQQYD